MKILCWTTNYRHFRLWFSMNKSDSFSFFSLLSTLFISKFYEITWLRKTTTFLYYRYWDDNWSPYNGVVVILTAWCCSGGRYRHGHSGAPTAPPPHRSSPRTSLPSSPGRSHTGQSPHHTVHRADSHTPQHSAARRNPRDTQPGTATTWYSTVQYNAIQYSTVQYITEFLHH